MIGSSCERLRFEGFTGTATTALWSGGAGYDDHIAIDSMLGGTSYEIGLTGKFRVDSSGNAEVANVKVGGNQVVGARGAAVADASGGATVDASARAAINALLARLRTHGLIAT